MRRNEMSQTFKLVTETTEINAWGDFESWEKYCLEGAADAASYDAIAVALDGHDLRLQVEAPGQVGRFFAAEELAYRNKFADALEAEQFEAQCLSAALDAITPDEKEFILAGINRSPIPGYWDWLTSQITEEK
jgi:hypothetical protein